MKATFILFLSKLVFPNFIGDEKIFGETLELVNNNTVNLKDKIILIENADPGFDWIFGHEIIGLITKFGGTNSHMAIRCAEFNLPAAIGCGEQIYFALRNSKKISLDCSAKVIKVIC